MEDCKKEGKGCCLKLGYLKVPPMSAIKRADLSFPKGKLALQGIMKAAGCSDTNMPLIFQSSMEFINDHKL